MCSVFYLLTLNSLLFVCNCWCGNYSVTNKILAIVTIIAKLNKLSGWIWQHCVCTSNSDILFRNFPHLKIFIVNVILNTVIVCIIFTTTIYIFILANTYCIINCWRICVDINVITANFLFTLICELQINTNCYLILFIEIIFCYLMYVFLHAFIQSIRTTICIGKITNETVIAS